MPFRFDVGCCCSVSCVRYSDSFDRPDSSTLGGAGWNKAAGDCEIKDNALAFISEPDAAAKFTTLAGDVLSHRTIINSDTSGDSAKIYLTYTDANSNTYAELVFGTGTIRVASKSSGTITILKECSYTLDVDTDYDILVIVDSSQGSSCDTSKPDLYGGYSCSVFVDDDFALGSLIFAGGFGPVGLGTGTCSGTVSFKSWSISYSSINNAAAGDGANCPESWVCCWPGKGYRRIDNPYSQMRVTISGFDYPGNTLDGTYDLDLVPIGTPFAALGSGFADTCHGYCATYKLEGLTGLGCDNGSFLGCAPTEAYLYIGAVSAFDQRCQVYFVMSHYSTVFGEPSCGAQSATAIVTTDCGDNTITLTPSGGCWGVHPGSTVITCEPIM